jgi:transcription-repair coupling factor (superfamily II helicase)
MSESELTHTLRPLLALAAESREFRSLASAVDAAAASGSDPVEAHMSAGIRPYLLAALLESEQGLAGRPALLATADDRSARDLASELGAYLAPRRVRFYPSRGTGWESHLAPPPHLVGLRIAALDSLVTPHRPSPVAGLTANDGAAPLVVASAIALAEAVPDESLRPGGLTIHRGEEVSLDDLAELLIDCGYERVDQVEDRGQFAVRGGILDLFGSTEDQAARIELFGDEVESIRRFSTFTQRSLGESDAVEVAPAAEVASAHIDGQEELALDQFSAFLDLLPERTAVITAAADEIGPSLADHWSDVSAATHEDAAKGLYVEVADSLAAKSALSVTTQHADHEHSFRAATPTSPARTIGEAEAELSRQLRAGYVTVVPFEHHGEAERARYNIERLDAEFLGTEPPARGPALFFTQAPVTEGFVSPELKLVVFPYRRLVHRRRSAAPAPARGPLATFGELKAGDLVVHEDHGIARFTGFDTKTLAGITRDYLALAYRGDDRVFVPADQLAKISRYLGASGADPELSALGGKRWEGIKARAHASARALAGELLNLYAEREARRGHAFPPDGEWQLQLERAFPYRETADQLEAIEAVKADMESERPMDRLICGDVGYGKTEVALRAAHKAAGDGRQVMMLVPTTILAQQHLGTFSERLRDFPFEIEMVSRLRRPAETKAALAGFADGGVDILIGTHRLLSRDVRAKDLGLVIVDEEQRFGVKQKELLRQLKLKVDVLALSATPIPRTLQMSLAGLRDISVIETPPEGRQPVRTYVGPSDDELIKQAIDREVARGGQAFYLHNRIETLPETAEHLRVLCPGATVIEAHGQLDERELEQAMLTFLRGDADVLAATTIIESGLDIPTANTLIVERADQLGLAQAYQIRGRVGRSRERAYAYMLYPSEDSLTQEAGARLATLSDHTELGSGFAIAMRDLELRGAGDLLGTEQSGHVAAIGFQLYVELLDEAVNELRSQGDRLEPETEVRLDLDVNAYVPGDYIPFEAAKIEVHRRIAAARAPGELRALRDELRDRFGSPPEPLEALIELQRARIEFRHEGAQAAELRGGRLAVGAIDLDSARVAAVREDLPEAKYESRNKTLSIRVFEETEDKGEARLAAATALAEALAKTRPERVAAPT